MPMNQYKATPIANDGNVEDLKLIPFTDTAGSNDPQHRNNARASFAARALIAYTGIVGGDDEPLDTQVSDLLGDILHLADAYGLDYDDMFATAFNNYDAEVSGEL